MLYCDLSFSESSRDAAVSRLQAACRVLSKQSGTSNYEINPSQPMSLSVINCPHCQAQNISTAQFCGECGKPTTANNPAASPTKANSTTGNLPHQDATHPASKDQWHEKAGLICGALSIFLCGAFASIPGIYFSWSSLTQAKAQGRSTTLSNVGLVLNVLGILATIVAIGLMILMVIMASVAPTGNEFDYSQPDPYGF